MGRIVEKPVVLNGKVVVRKILPIHWSFEERIDDGLNARDGIRTISQILTNPEKYLGCVKEDLSDAFILSDAGNAPTKEEIGRA